MPNESQSRVSTFDVESRQITANDACTDQACLLDESGTKIDGRYLFATVIETKTLTYAEAKTISEENDEEDFEKEKLLRGIYFKNGN